MDKDLKNLLSKKEKDLDDKIDEMVQKSSEKIRNEKIRRIAVVSFLLPPVIISVISLIHLYEFFRISNSVSLALAIAASFELVSIASLFALAILSKINKGALWTVFFVVAGYQIVGNVFASFVSIDTSLFAKFVNMFWMVDTIGSQRFIAIIQGAALPIVSLSLIKLAIDYLDWDNLDNI